MKHKPMNNFEFWLIIIIDFVFIGILNIGLGSWINYKLSKRLKDYEPLTAEKMLKRENYLNSKRELFFVLINLLNRNLAAAIWTGPEAPKNRILEGSRPTEVEINSCFSKLCLYVDDKKILKDFPYIFTDDVSPSRVGEYINLLRKDLGYGEGVITPDKYPYVFNSK